MDRDKVVVVAFDGMDYEIMERLDLDNLKQEEFGRIENDKGIKYRYTSELFASFITGSTYEEHGVVKLLKGDNNGVVRFLRQGLIPKFIRNNIRGFYTLNDISKRVTSYLLGLSKFKYDKTDLKKDSLFDKIDCSLPLFVPSYNPDLRWQLELPHGVVEPGNIKDVRKYSKKLTDSRLSEFLDVSFEFWDFVMLHLHDPDGVQDVGLGEYQKDYQRLDGVAEKILRAVPDDYVVIFMSDHGLLEGDQHNKNAFYSCNQELFEEETPHITDFHDKILKLTGNLEDEK